MPDTLWWREKKYFIYDEPLDPVFWSLRPPFKEIAFFNTGCSRGHIATWKIVNDELFLTELFDVEGGTEEFTIDDLFPHGERMVFARWFTGRLTLIPEPENENSYLPHLRDSEHNIVLHVEAGQIDSTGDHMSRNSEIKATTVDTSRTARLNMKRGKMRVWPGFDGKFKVPSVSSTIIVASAIALIGFVNIAAFSHVGLIFTVTSGDINFGIFQFPYRWLLSGCVLVVAGRLLLRRCRL